MRFRQAGSLAIADEREIVDYVLIFGDGSYVTDAVCDLIKKGWQPFGSIAITADKFDKFGGYQRFAQPMVKYAPDDVEKTAPVEVESDASADDGEWLKPAP